MSIPILLFVLLGNLWIWQIFSFNVILGFITFGAAIFLYLALSKNKKFSPLFLVLFSLILIFQWGTTERVSLTKLSNDEQRLQQMRLGEYPREQLRLGYWFEGRPESIAFFRILKNFSEAIDPNLYFFANHPRERVGIRELEKFPYIFLPFFLLGLFRLISTWRTKLLLVSALPIILLSFIGHKNPLGPFSLLPFLGVVMAAGVEASYKKLQKLPGRPKKLGFLVSIVIFLAVLLQNIAYAKY